MASKALVVRADDGFDLPPLGKEDGTTFGWFDRWNMGSNTQDGKFITDLSDWAARDMHGMLTQDYKAKQMENVLTLPLTSAEYTIQPSDGDNGEAKWLKTFWEADYFSGGCRTSLDQIIGLMTAAFYYKRTYFEKVWTKGTGMFAGKVVYSDVAWRPQTTCRLVRDPQNGRFMGFEQESYYVGPTVRSMSKWPIHIPPSRAFVYTHGTRRDPLNGTSDMEVAYWAWKTKQKVLMLWFQFLQSVSLPRIVVKAGASEQAREVAREIARMKSSGVLPVATGGTPDSVAIDVLDTSGKGADQFKAAIEWLDTAATQSILAGFLDLTLRAATAGAGSYALSKDASDFFLQSLEAKAREMEDQIRRQLFAPLIRHNFGPDAAVPRLQFEPLNDIDKDASVQLLKQAMAAPPGGPVPTSFIAALAGQVATYLGMDGETAREDFKKSFDAAAAQAQAKALAESPGGGSPTGQAVAGIAGAVGAAHKALQSGLDPKAAFQAHVSDQRAQAQHSKVVAAKAALLQKHTANAVKAKTGGAVSLSNEDTDLAGFNPAQARGPGGTWTKGSGQQQGKPKQKMRLKNFEHLEEEKTALTAEVKALRARLTQLHAANHIGAHRGQAGKHAGAKGSTKSKTKAPPTKAAGSGSARGSGSSKPMSLPAQVAHLKTEVEQLKREVVTAEQAKARRARRH